MRRASRKAWVEGSSFGWGGWVSGGRGAGGTGLRTIVDGWGDSTRWVRRVVSAFVMIAERVRRYDAEGAQGPEVELHPVPVAEPFRLPDST